MPPQITPTSRSSVVPTAAPVDPSRKGFIPLLLLIFLGLCLAYTLSYVLYRIIRAHRRESQQDTPESSDRGVSQFMNGARLTLNFGHKPTTPMLSESPAILDEEKPLADPSHPVHEEVPMSSPADSASTPLMALVPSFAMHPDQEPSQPQLKEQDPSPDPTLVSAPPAPPAPAHQPFSQRMATKVGLLSTDREEAIALDPKLAPVQGPLRRLSTIPSPSRKKRMTLFGLGLKHPRARDGELETDPGAGDVVIPRCPSHE